MYTYNTQFDIAAGLYYLRFKKSKTSSDSNPLANITGLSALNDNDAWIFGLKLAHHF
ncbi:MAG: outer membrane protein transport protein [Acinetobacter sp.]|nr:outer membrane protein transport protein [Acinetobacter sp.]